MATYGIGQPNSVEKIFSDSIDDSSSFSSIGDRINNAERTGKTTSFSSYVTEHSQTPISEVRSNAYFAENIINELLNEINNNLSKVNINIYSNVNLEAGHKAVWKDALKHHEKAKELPVPDYATYEEYQYASQHQCRSCRDFVKNYELTISHTTFGYLVEIKKLLQFILNEVIMVKNIVIHHFSDSYKDEFEAEIAKHLMNWVKAVSHYVKQLASEITTPPISIPASEIESLNEAHAARFQSFFALKINSYTSEIQTITNLIKRDSVDIAESFYSNYLLPALKFKSSVIEPLSLDFSTSDLIRNNPTLAGELVIAQNAVSGNLGSVITDYVERRIQFSSRMDGLLQLIKMKRRYVNYILNMEPMAIKRTNVIAQTSDENIETYKDIFTSIAVDSENRNNLRSFHSQLDGLDEDAHPQYLRRDGGTITGSITMAPGATIGGIAIAEHTHSGIDGSAPISATSIDYESGRESYFLSDNNLPYSNLKLTNLQQNILIGGNVNYDATFEIEIQDDKINSYEFEILYNEV
jgi:hypothetical protein